MTGVLLGLSIEDNSIENNMKDEKGKRDIKSLISIIPPADQLKETVKKIREKRIRVRYGNVKPNQLLINPKLVKDLSLEGKAVIVVGGKKRFLLEIVEDEKVPVNEAFMNMELMKENGIADNSIATVRKP